MIRLPVLWIITLILFGICNPSAFAGGTPPNLYHPPFPNISTGSFLQYFNRTFATPSISSSAFTNLSAPEVDVYVGNADPRTFESMYTSAATNLFTFLFTSASYSVSAGDYILVPSSGAGMKLKYPVRNNCERYGDFLKVTVIPTKDKLDRAWIGECYADYTSPDDSVFTALYYSVASNAAFTARVHIVKPRASSWVDRPVFTPVIEDNFDAYSYGLLSYSFTHPADMPPAYLYFSFPITIPMNQTFYNADGTRSDPFPSPSACTVTVGSGPAVYAPILSIRTLVHPLVAFPAFAAGEVVRVRCWGSLERPPTEGYVSTRFLFTLYPHLHIPHTHPLVTPPFSPPLPAPRNKDMFLRLLSSVSLVDCALGQPCSLMLDVYFAAKVASIDAAAIALILSNLKLSHLSCTSLTDDVVLTAASYADGRAVFSIATPENTPPPRDLVVSAKRSTMPLRRVPARATDASLDAVEPSFVSPADYITEPAALERIAVLSPVVRTHPRVHRRRTPAAVAASLPRSTASHGRAFAVLSTPTRSSVPTHVPAARARRLRSLIKQLSHGSPVTHSSSTSASLSSSLTAALPPTSVRPASPPADPSPTSSPLPLSSLSRRVPRPVLPPSVAALNASSPALALVIAAAKRFLAANPNAPIVLPPSVSPLRPGARRGARPFISSVHLNCSVTIHERFPAPLLPVSIMLTGRARNGDVTVPLVGQGHSYLKGSYVYQHVQGFALDIAFSQPYRPHYRYSFPTIASQFAPWLSQWLQTVIGRYLPFVCPHARVVVPASHAEDDEAGDTQLLLSCTVRPRDSSASAAFEPLLTDPQFLSALVVNAEAAVKDIAGPLSKAERPLAQWFAARSALGSFLLGSVELVAHDMLVPDTINGLLDADEVDVDCGGSAGVACPSVSSCVTDDDCSNGLCERAVVSGFGSAVMGTCSADVEVVPDRGGGRG